MTIHFRRLRLDFPLALFSIVSTFKSSCTHCSKNTENKTNACKTNRASLVFSLSLLLCQFCIWVHVRVDTYARTHARTHALMYAFAHAHTHARAQTHTHIRAHTHTRTHTNTYTYTVCTRRHTFFLLHVNSSSNAPTIYLSIYLSIYLFIYLFIYCISSQLFKFRQALPSRRAIKLLTQKAMFPCNAWPLATRCRTYSGNRKKATTIY